MAKNLRSTADITILLKAAAVSGVEHSLTLSNASICVRSILRVWELIMMLQVVTASCSTIHILGRALGLTRRYLSLLRFFSFFRFEILPFISAEIYFF